MSIEKPILVETSARHLHVSQKDLEILFGKGYKLTHKKDLSQPGQFSCEERVDVVGPKKTIKGVTILGPVRPNTQVEISATDARSIGVAAPVRESGDIVNTPGCTLVGPAAELEIECGVIVAKRHIHMTPEDAENLGVIDKQIVGIKVDSDSRNTVFGDCVIRVHENFALAIHIDTDESNASGASLDQIAVIVENV